jgi:formate dehydrogenase subunit delta
MDADNLVRMANQIGDFFSAMPDRDEAKGGIADHLRKFWDPRMREQLFAHIDRQHAAGLAPLVLEAVTEQRGQLVRTAATEADE